MFAPKRSASDLKALDQVRDWWRGQLKDPTDLRPYLVEWSQQVFGEDREIVPSQLTLELGFADVGSGGTQVVSDGNVWLELNEDGGRSRYSTTLTIMFSIEADRQPPVRVEFVSIPDTIFTDRKALAVNK